MTRLNQPRLIFSALLISLANAQNLTTQPESLWLNLGKLTRILFRSCSIRDSPETQLALVASIQSCFKENILRLLNKTLHSDIIEITDGVAFIKYRDTGHNYTRTTETNLLYPNNEDDSHYWTKQLMGKISEIFETHLLRIRLEDFVLEQDGKKEARFRRRRNNMMPFMVFGVVAMGMILIPMGFKFLTILGGKALLLAKMALILTSIQGLKKVATSGLNYGLYHAQPGHYDRQWYHENSGPTIQWETNIDDIPDEQLDLLHNTHLRP